MPRIINIVCPCGNVVNHVKQPDNWPASKVTRGRTRCNSCKKEFAYEICDGRCDSWYT